MEFFSKNGTFRVIEQKNSPATRTKSAFLKNDISSEMPKKIKKWACNPHSYFAFQQEWYFSWS